MTSPESQKGTEPPILGEFRNWPIDLRVDGTPDEPKGNLQETPPSPAWVEGDRLRVSLGLEGTEADGSKTILVANSPAEGGDAFIERIHKEDIPPLT